MFLTLYTRLHQAQQLTKSPVAPAVVDPAVFRGTPRVQPTSLLRERLAHWQPQYTLRQRLASSTTAAAHGRY